MLQVRIWKAIFHIVSNVTLENITRFGECWLNGDVTMMERGLCIVRFKCGSNILMRGNLSDFVHAKDGEREAHEMHSRVTFLKPKKPIECSEVGLASYEWSTNQAMATFAMSWWCLERAFSQIESLKQKLNASTLFFFFFFIFQAPNRNSSENGFPMRILARIDTFRAKMKSVNGIKKRFWKLKSDFTGQKDTNEENFPRIRQKCQFNRQ